MNAPGSPKPSGLAVNTALMMMGIVSVSVFMFATDLVLIAGYGDVVHGKIVVALSIAIFGAILCDVGLASKAGVKTIAALRQRGEAEAKQLARQTAQLLLILMGIAAAAALVLWLSGPWLGAVFNLPAWMLRYSAVWLLAGAGVRASMMVLIGFEQMALAMVITFCAEAGRFAWTCVCVGQGLEIETLYIGWAATWLGSMFLGFGLNWRMMRRARASLNPLPLNSRELASTVWHGLPYLVPMLSAQALAPLTFTLAGLLLAHDDDGVKHISTLRICFTLALGIRILSQSVATSFFPIIARHTAQGQPPPPHLLATLRRATHILSLAALAMFVGLLCLGGYVLALIDWLSEGTTVYASALPVLLILTLAISADCYRVQIDQLLMGTGRIRVVTLGESAKLVLLLIALPLGILLSPDDPALTIAVVIFGVLLAIAWARTLGAAQRYGPVGGGLALRTLLVMAVLLPLTWVDGYTWLALPAAVVGAALLRLVNRDDIRGFIRVVQQITGRSNRPAELE